MIVKLTRLAMVASIFMPAMAHADPLVVLQPVQTRGQSIRFDRGLYVVDLLGRRAAVQVRSIVGNRDGIAFDVGVLNLSTMPINIDVGDMRVEGTTQPVRVLTRSELEHRAENRAKWAKIWTVVGTSLAAAGQASQRSHYTVTTMTSHGSFQSTVSGPCFGCEVAANRTLLAGHARVADIQATLDQTRVALGEQAFQLTTIEPDRAYQGRVLLTKFKRQAGGEVRLIVTVNGEPFTFGFRFVPDGSPSPEYSPMTGPVAGIMPATAEVEPRPSPLPSPTFTAATVIAPRYASAAFNQAGPATPALTSGRISAAAQDTRRNWQRYYSNLVANGVSRAQAKQMADEELGPID